jgi:hypothetical protein
MDLGGLLSKYLNPGAASAPEAEQHFEQVAQHAPTETVSQGISDALRSDQTPSLGDMVSQAFSRADPQQRAGMLNEILSSVGPNVLASLGGGAAGGVLGSILNELRTGATPQVTPQQASQVPPSTVQDLANHAEKHDASIFDKLGDFYAQNPALVKALGVSVLGVALSKIAGRMRS